MASITPRIQLPSDHPKKKSLCLPTSIPGSDSDELWWMVRKVDPHYDAYRRKKSISDRPRRLIVRSREVSKPRRENINQSRGFETPRYLTYPSLIGYWNGVRGGEHTDSTPPCTKLVRTWNRLEESHARAPGSWWRLQLVFIALRIAMMWANPV